MVDLIHIVAHVHTHIGPRNPGRPHTHSERNTHSNGTHRHGEPHLHSGPHAYGGPHLHSGPHAYGGPHLYSGPPMPILHDLCQCLHWWFIEPIPLVLAAPDQVAAPEVTIGFSWSCKKI